MTENLKATISLLDGSFRNVLRNESILEASYGVIVEGERLREVWPWDRIISVSVFLPEPTKF